MLPLGLDVPLGRIIEATAEVERADDRSLLLRPVGPGATLTLDSSHDLVADGATELHHDGNRWTATSTDGAPIHLRSTTTTSKGSS